MSETAEYEKNVKQLESRHSLLFMFFFPRIALPDIFHIECVQ